MYLYEKALIEDINKLFINSKVEAVIADSLDEGLRRVAAKNEDKIVLPLIELVGGDWNIGDANFYSVMHGNEIFRTENNALAKNISNIPFTPNYEMYIIAQSSRECDMLTREIIFHYYQNPTLTVKIPYGLDVLHTFNISFGRNVRRQQRSSGLVYRILSITLDGAYLWHNNTMDIVKDVNVDVKEIYEKVQNN